MLSCSQISLRARLDGIVLSISNYPAKFFWVNLMPFVNVNVDSYLPCGSRGKLARFPVFVLGVYFHSLEPVQTSCFCRAELNCN